MSECRCGKGRMEETILPERIEDLGGVVVKLINAVHVYKCNECGEGEIEIPDLWGLTRAAAMARALMPVQLSGSEIRFMRRALDMTQQEFAGAMEITVETVSRWETGRPAGGMAEKLVRHNVCALLHGQVPAVEYDPATITHMRIIPRAEDQALRPIEFGRVVVKHDHKREQAWDSLAMAA